MHRRALLVGTAVVLAPARAPAMTAELVRANVDVIAAPIAISQSPLLRADEVIQ